MYNIIIVKILSHLAVGLVGILLGIYITIPLSPVVFSDFNLLRQVPSLITGSVIAGLFYSLGLKGERQRQRKKDCDRITDQLSVEKFQYQWHHDAFGKGFELIIHIKNKSLYKSTIIRKVELYNPKTRIPKTEPEICTDVALGLSSVNNAILSIGHSLGQYWIPLSPGDARIFMVHINKDIQDMLTNDFIRGCLIRVIDINGNLVALQQDINDIRQETLQLQQDAKTMRLHTNGSGKV